MKTLLPKTEIERIIEDIIQIRTLTSPQIDEIVRAEDYYALLRRNFEQIRRIARDSVARHEQLLTPLMRSEEALSDEDADTLVMLCRALLNQTHVAELDLTLVFHLSGRLMRDAEEKDDDEGLIRALFIRINACYANLIRVNRLRVADEMTRFFMEEGLKAADALLPYLSQEKFIRLTGDRTRHEVLTMSYFYVALYDVPFVTPEINRLRLNTLIQAYERMRDPFYLEHAPSYNRHTGMIRCLEHMGQLTELGNAWGYTEEQCSVITSYIEEELNTSWQENPEQNEEILPGIHLQLLLARNRYYDGQLSARQYRGHLLALYQRHANDRYDQYSLFANLVIPTEYLASFTPEEATHIDAETARTMERIYRKVVAYMLHSTNEGAHYFLLEYVSNFLEVFIELPQGMTFLQMGLECIAALYPPTYIHSVMTARIARFLTKELIRRTPQALTGVRGITDAAEVAGREAAILHEVFYGALCHDFGKIPMMDTLFIFWRERLEEDLQILAKKQRAGAHLLRRYASTAPYADYAASAGHSDDLLISIAGIAHEIDAATDITCRVLREEEPFSGILDRICDTAKDTVSSGITDLLRDTDVRQALRMLVETARAEVSEKTFLLLKTGVFPSGLLPAEDATPTAAAPLKELPVHLREMRNSISAIIGMGEAILTEHNAEIRADHATAILQDAYRLSLLTHALPDAGEDIPASEEAPRILKARHWPAFTAPDASILCLDQSRSFLSAFAALLKPLKVRLSVTDASQQFLEMVCASRYDLILIDDGFPLTGDRGLLSRVRSLDASRNQETPAIALTASDCEAYLSLLADSGFSGLLVKPFGGAMLEETLLKHLPPGRILFQGPDTPAL